MPTRSGTEYEGYLDIEESLITGLIALASELIADVENLTRSA